MSSSDISIHLNALLQALPPVAIKNSLPTNKASTAAASNNAVDQAQAQAWERLIDRWEDELAVAAASATSSRKKVEEEEVDADEEPPDVDLEVEEDSPPEPSLLDYYDRQQHSSAAAAAAAAAKTAESTNGAGGAASQGKSRPAGQDGERVPIGAAQATSTSTTTTTHAAGIDPAIASLVERIRSRLPDPSMLGSLRDLLASPRSADELQEELVNMFGFEDGSFELIAEILASREVRGDVARALKSSSSSKANATIASGRQTPGGGPSHGSFTPNGVAAAASANHHHLNGLNGAAAGPIGYSPSEIAARIQAQLDAASSRPLFSSDGPSHAGRQEQYPHVYTSASSAGVTAASSYGGRLALPLGTIRKEDDTKEEVVIPPAIPVPPKGSERLIPVAELGPLAGGCFPGYTTLNRVQSIVQPCAMGTSENMLVCAPTGAGKTDVAIMAILRVLLQHLHPSAANGAVPGPHSIRRDDFKIVYVAPMKALAAEITRKFAKRLAWLGIKVRELTGDMQLTKREIDETQVILITPEKLDVVTRKRTGEGEIAAKMKLLIIDEVHLLNEDRGAVIETIVARTLRLVESTQTPIRIVGLSATLPNYVDVSDFLRVNRYQGLFYFDSSFRPVPLEQHFIGCRGKARSETLRRNSDKAVFDKAAEMLRDGHQVMVFVHARKETVKAAEKLKEMALAEGNTEDFDPRSHPHFDFFRRELSVSKNKELKQLFDFGFGIHHAGMLRTDRNMVERAFEAGVIKVLCCTATLAWGVNLPAHAVIIKGTNVYDASKGAFVDLSILDVLQIFGRAGRPGFETSGVAFLVTGQDKLDHYLDAVLSQHPIESKFVPGMLDSLNAEISLGTIANVPEAIEWLGYTYLFVRMKRNPFVYGMPHDIIADDPQLGTKRDALVQSAGKRLADAKMVQFDELTNKFTITDLGRIAAKYYLKHETVEVFNKQFKSRMTEADCLDLLSQSTEFLQIQVRENEVEELKKLMKDVIPCQVRGGTDTTPGKVNILLQAYICCAQLEDFALVSDCAYVAQNAARIIRALLEIALSRRWASASMVLASMSKSIEKRQWSYENPLKQSHLQKLVLHNLESYADDYTPAEVAAFSPEEMGEMIRMNARHGAAVVSAAKQFPHLAVTYHLRPLTEDLLRVDVELERDFDWNENLHGGAEPFYVWIEDATGIDIFQSQHALVRRSTRRLPLEFMVPIREEIPSHVTIKVISDRWVGCEETIEVDLSTLVMPATSHVATPLLNIPFLSVNSVVHDDKLETSYGQLFPTLNSIQSQLFWPMHHTDQNLLLAAPNASGKSTLADFATWRAIKRKSSSSSSSKVLYVCGSQQSARETSDRLDRIGVSSGKGSVMHLRSMRDHAKFKSGSSGGIGVITSHALAVYGADLDLDLLILDDLHLLDAEYELAVIGLRKAMIGTLCRIVALTSSLQDITDLSAWLGIDEMGTYVFRPSDRPYPLVTSVQTFGIQHSIALLKAMVKPTYAAIKQDATGNAIVFAPSRGQCTMIANDLVTQSGTEMDLNGFLNATRAEIEPFAARLRDQSLSEPILHGIGVYHEGMSPRDMTLNLELFAAGILRALVVSRDACWSLPVQASTVVVMGAQYLEIKTNEEESKVVDGEHVRVTERSTKSYSLHEIVRMQTFAARPPPYSLSSGNNNASRRFLLFCQPEQREVYLRFLNNGLPLESSLVNALRHEPGTERTCRTARDVIGKDATRQDVVDALATSYLWRRMQANPTYYDVVDGEQVKALSRLADSFLDGFKDR